MSQKTTISDLISLGSIPNKKIDWTWYISFFKWFLTTHNTKNEQKIDYLLHILNNNHQFRDVFIQKWILFMEQAQFDSFWINSFSGESDSFFQEIIWAINQKIISAPPREEDASYLFDEVLKIDSNETRLSSINISQMEKFAVFFPQDKLTEFSSNLHKSLIRAMYMLSSKNMTDIYSLFFKTSLTTQEGFKFTQIMNIISLTNITDIHEFKKSTIQFIEIVDLAIDDFRNSGVSLNTLFKIKKMKFRLNRIQYLISLFENFDSNAFTSILLERKKFESVKFQILHYSSQLIEIVATTSAESGDHYIGRTKTAITNLFYSACGGGLVTGLTVFIKTLSSYIHLAPFVMGFMHGINYALSFVAIYLLGFSLATKQPAAIAAHMTRKWRTSSKVEFLAEIDFVFKSQFWAILGNVGIVIPTVLILSYLTDLAFSKSFMTPEKAHMQIQSMSILSFTPFYAFLTGYFLWFSTFVSGVADNFFKVYKIDELILRSPKVFGLLNPIKKRKLVDFIKNNFGALCGNITLGFILGIVPVVGDFFGLPIDVRHVTLSSGNIAAAIYTLGTSVFLSYEIYLAIAGVIVTGLLNLIVSFMISLRVAESSSSTELNKQALPYSKNLLTLYILKKLRLR